MPGINGAIYQIGNWTNLKPEVPGILKEYAKAAIRTDPRDLLQWQVETHTHQSIADQFRSSVNPSPPPLPTQSYISSSQTSPARPKSKHYDLLCRSGRQTSKVACVCVCGFRFPLIFFSLVCPL